MKPTLTLGKAVRCGGKIGTCVVVASLAVAPMAMAVEVQMRQEPEAVAVPTQPVASKNLEAPTFDSDTRHIQAILDRDDDISEKKPVATPLVVKAATVTATPVATPVVIPVATIVASSVAVATPVVTENIAPKMDASPSGAMVDIHAFAARWHEVFDMLFSAALVVVALLLYRHSKIQTQILVASVRAAEDAARAAQTSARLAQEHAAQLRQGDYGRDSFDL